MKVILMGYMGSGKSTIGVKLSNVLGYDFIDLDHYIVEREKKSIAQIFNESGEIYFRKKEHYYLKEVLKSKDIVLSLGGGTPCYGNNIDVIINSEDSKEYYLKGSIPFLAERLFYERENRPLISHLDTIEKLQEFIGKHLFERGFYYNQANSVIDIDNKLLKDVVEELVLDLF